MKCNTDWHGTELIQHDTQYHLTHVYFTPVKHPKQEVSES